MKNLASEARSKLLQRREALFRLYRATRTPPAGAEVVRFDGPSAVGPLEAPLAALLSDRERVELVEIVAALARIDGGTFGRCERCGNAIGRQRLAAVPEARLCISCSELRAP
jgi:DnaK suppressor protein